MCLRHLWVDAMSWVGNLTEELSCEISENSCVVILASSLCYKPSLGYNVLYYSESHPTFRRNISHPLSGLGSKTIKKPEWITLRKFLPWHTLRPWRWSRYIPLKRRLTFTRLYTGICLKTIFTVAPVRTSYSKYNPVKVKGKIVPVLN
jgi:hypothetical protein